MAKKLGHRQKKTFVCSVCGNENYREEKNVNILQEEWRLVNIVNSVVNTQLIKRRNNNITVI